MEIIVHRINTARELKETPRECGVEVDLRSRDGKIIMNHEPFSKGEGFEEFCREYAHGTLVLNTKEDGLEKKTAEILEKNGINSFFFLDLPMPTIIRLAKGGEKRLAARFSEYEPLQAALALKGKVEWVWVDCFKGFVLDGKNYAKLRKHFKICLVSPELQGRKKEEIEVFREKIAKIGAKIDAVCTDFPRMWLE